MNNENNTNLEREYAWAILDYFEDLLDEKGIDIPSDDRDGDEGEARLYGSEYFDLEDKIVSLLKSFRNKVTN